MTDEHCDNCLPIGDLLDSLGVRGCLAEELANGWLVSDALVLLKVVTPTGAVEVRSAFADGSDWVARRALLEIGRDAERGLTKHDAGGDDE